MGLFRLAPPPLEFAAKRGLPPPRNGDELDRLHDFWDAEVAARLALALTLSVFVVPPALAALTVYDPALRAALLVPAMFTTAACALFGLICGISAIKSGIRSGFPAPSRLYPVAIAVSLAVCPLVLLTIGAIPLVAFSGS